MRHTKFISTLVASVLAFSFTVSIGIAQIEDPPISGTDEDGDQIIGEFPGVNTDTALPRFDISDWDAYVDHSMVAGVIQADASPIYPVDEYVYTNYPTFQFSEDAGALRYQIEVYDIIAEPDVLVYRYKGPPACVIGLCSLKPTTALKSLTIITEKGLYA